MGWGDYRPSGVRGLVSLGFVFACAYLFMVWVAHLDPASGISWVQGVPNRVLLLNAAPGLVMFFVLAGLTGRSLFSLLVVSLGYAVFYHVNAVKLEHLGAQLMPQDLAIVSASSMALLSNYLSVSWAAIGAGFAALLLVLAAFRWEPRPLRPTWLAIGVMFATALWLAHAWDRDVRPGSAAMTLSGFEFEVWNPARTSEMSGLVTAFTLFSRVRASTPDVYPEDRDASIDLIADMLPLVGSLQRSSVDPDIVLLQSEAWFDPSSISGVGRGEFLSELYQAGIPHAVGPMFVPTYGGGTIRTEFEALTAVSLRNLPLVTYPYLELDLRRIPSIADSLAGAGYETHAVHPNNPDFWRRGEAFRNFGFQGLTWLGGFTNEVENDGPYASDASLVDEIVSILSRPSQRPRFVFGVSIQNHGPYTWHDNLDNEVFGSIQAPAGPSNEASTQLRTYLYHFERGQAQLVRLIEAVMDRDRPALVFIFGDHLPSLPAVYDELGLTDGQDPHRAPSRWACVAVGGGVCPASGRALASRMVPGVLELSTKQASQSDPFFLMKYQVPAELATLTHAPTAADGADVPVWAEPLVDRVRNLDAARVNGDFSQRHVAAEGLSKRPALDSSPLRFGRYIDERYQVIGFSSAFEQGEYFYGVADLSGFSHGAKMEYLLRNEGGELVLKRDMNDVTIRGALRRNIDFGPEVLQLSPGRYVAELRVDGRVLGSGGVEITVKDSQALL